MADNKQPQLNGAYYGPAIPPQERRHHPSRGRSCCCCLFSFIWKLLLAIIVIAGLVILIFWLVVQPRSFKFYVSEAQLTRFEYDSNNTLHYDFVLNFTARNPNKKLSIYYDKVEGRAFYEGNRFNTTDVITHMNSFRQYKKSSSPMSGVFKGQQVLPLDTQDLSSFNEDKTNGAFDIVVKLYFRIRFRLGDVISGDFHPKATCELKVPLSSNTTTVAGFQYTKCDVDF